MVKCPCCLTWSFLFRIRCRPSQFSLQHRNLGHAPRKPSLIFSQLICLHDCVSSLMEPFRAMVIDGHDFLSVNEKLNIFSLHASPSFSCVHCDGVNVIYHVFCCALFCHEIYFCSSAYDETLIYLFHVREISFVGDAYPCCDFEICKIND